MPPKINAMADDANCGVMLWDGRSKRTLNNIQNLLHLGKKILTYLRTYNAFRKLSTEEDPHRLLDRCGRTRTRRGSIKSRPRVASKSCSNQL